MKVCLVISSLRCGGAERVMTILAKAWVDEGWDVTLITLNSPDTDFYTLDERVSRRSLSYELDAKNIVHGLWNNITRIKLLRATIVEESPDCIISFLEATNINTLIASIGLKIPVFVSIRTDPRHYLIGAIRNRMRKFLYPMAAAVVVQTETVALWLKREIPNATPVVIPNPVKESSFVKSKRHKSLANKRVVVGMGRLVEKKGFDMLIPAFSRCVKEGLDWELVIIGIGPLESELKTLAINCGVGRRVSFPGQLRDPDSVLLESDIFVLSSRTEGFPNALLEAMCCGLPAIAFDCESGPSDLIVNGTNGLLVSKINESHLYSELSALMRDDNSQQFLGEHAGKIREKYSLKRIGALWSSLLRESILANFKKEKL